MKRRVHADLCVNRQGSLLTKRAQSFNGPVFHLGNALASTITVRVIGVGVGTMDYVQTG